MLDAESHVGCHKMHPLSKEDLSILLFQSIEKSKSTKRRIMPEEVQAHNELLTLTTEIVSSHVANNTVAVGDLASIIENVYSTLSRLGAAPAAPAPKPEPAVSVRASVKPDFIVCLEDGKKLKMLKRHLMTHYNMTPEEYRVKWGLPADYPMVAPNYAQQRKDLALKIGLGTRRAAKIEA